MTTATDDIVFTDHAEKRMRLRRITRRMVMQALADPDRREPEADGDTRFVKAIDDRKLHVVAKYLDDERKWLVISTWVRGEADPLPLWRRVVSALRRLLRGR